VEDGADVIEFDAPTSITATVIAVIFYGLAVYRFAVKRERGRAEQRASRFELHYRSHRCPAPVVKTITVERQHNPWKPQPWMEVGS
jgi:hypothetical protein